MRTFFKQPLSDLEQYWAGLIHADGSLSKQGRVVLGQKDRHMLEEFLKFLDQDSLITEGHRNSNFGSGVMYSASTSKGYSELMNLGIKTEPTASLLESRHFWRGILDGDGTITVDKRGCAVIVLCTGKERDAKSFADWVARLFNYRGPKPREDWRGVWYVNIGAGKARALGLYLYEGQYSAVPRKQNVALSFRDLVSRTQVRLLDQDHQVKRSIASLQENVTLWQD